MNKKKITKSSKQVKAEREIKNDIRCPECNKTTGTIIDIVVENDKVTRKYRCIFPDCGCEYEIEEEHNGVVHVETGESMWNSGGMQVL